VEKQAQDLSIAYIIAIMALMFIAQYFLIAKSVETLSYSQFKTLLKNNQVSDIVIREKYINGSIKPEAVKDILAPQRINELGVRAKKPVPFEAVRVEDSRLMLELEEAGIPFKGEITSDWLSVALSWLMPVVIFFVLWSLLSNRMGRAGGRLDADRQEQGEGVYRKNYRCYIRRR
jgi:cell division protease FtsH